MTVKVIKKGDDSADRPHARQASPKQLEHWRKTVEELETFYKDYPLPDGPIQLSECETIVDPKKFVETSLVMIRYNFGNNTFAPDVKRLLMFQKVLKNLNLKSA